jgi:hypothetical protein
LKFLFQNTGNLKLEMPMQDIWRTFDHRFNFLFPHWALSIFFSFILVHYWACVSKYVYDHIDNMFSWNCIIKKFILKSTSLLFTWFLCVNAYISL